MKLAFVLLSLAGCTIDVSIEGKRCPCAEGYTCDVLRNTCARSACAPALEVSELSPLWATAHDIRWAWQTVGPEESFLRYELRLAESKEDLAAMAGSARHVGPEENPELGGYRLPVNGDVVIATTTRGLPAGTIHWAQLLVVDVNDCAFASQPVARGTRPEPLGTIEIFRDALPVGSQLYPAAAMLVADGTGAHLGYSAADDPECVPEGVPPEDINATCGNPLRVQELSIELSEDPSQPQLARLSHGSFEGAYLEMHFSNVSPIASYYTNVWLWMAGCSDQYGYDGFTLPPSADYVRFEVPLAALRTAAGPLSYAAMDLQASGTPLCGFGLSATWHKTSVARLDDVLIRY